MVSTPIVQRDACSDRETRSVLVAAIDREETAPVWCDASMSLPLGTVLGQWRHGRADSGGR